MNILATDQTSVKECIYDFNQAMLSAGLIRTNDTNQLDASDINNIPDLNLLKLTGTLTSQFTDTTQCVAHLPLVYSFTDSMQSTNPIYISFTFKIAQNWFYNAQLSNPVGYTCFVTVSIGSSTNGAGVIVSPYSFTNIAMILTNAAVSSYLNDFTKQTLSYINYDDNIGLLNISICPKMNTGLITDTTSLSYSMSTNLNLIRFCIKRLLDGSYIIIDPNKKIAPSNYNSINNSETKCKIIYKNISSQQDDTNLSTLSTFSQNQQNFVNNKMICSPITILLQDNSISYDPYILIGSTELLGNKSFVEYDVIMNSNETHRYVTWSPYDGDTVFNDNITNRLTSLLIYEGRIL
jgi:hypothetical protein